MAFETDAGWPRIVKFRAIPALAGGTQEKPSKKRSDSLESTEEASAQESGYSNTDLRGVGVGRAFYDARFQGGPKGGVASLRRARLGRDLAL